MTGLSLRGDRKVVTTEKGEYEAKSVIIANGAKRRKLGCAGEDAFLGRGVSYCGVCDGNFFRGKTVCVIGGGNTAFEDALYLAQICTKVYLIYRRPGFGIQSVEADEVRAKENIELRFSGVPERIFGAARSRALSSAVPTAARTTSLRWTRCSLRSDSSRRTRRSRRASRSTRSGYVAAGEDCATNVPGVYAAGDTRTKRLRQIITAASDGAIAATAAVEYLRGVKA